MVSVFECSLRINLLGMVVCGESGMVGMVKMVTCGEGGMVGMVKMVACGEGGMVGMVKMVTCVLSEKKWDGQDGFFST